MHQRGIIPRNERILPSISTSLEETIADMATCWDELSVLQVLSAMVTSDPQII